MVPEIFGVPLEGDRDFGELCGSHQGCQGPEALRSKINYPTLGSNFDLESNSRSLLMKFSVSLLSGNY